MGINEINTEQWAPCPISGYEHYQVSNFGRVKNTKTGRFKKACEDKDGYLRFCLCSGGSPVTLSVHRLVWMAFCGEIPSDLQVDHIDSDRKNNKLENLQLLTPRENLLKRRPFSDEARARMSTSRKAYFAAHPMTEEARARLSAAQKARFAAHPMTEEDKEKMSASMKAYFAAHPISDETRARMSAARKAYLARQRAAKSES